MHILLKIITRNLILIDNLTTTNLASSGVLTIPLNSFVVKGRTNSKV